MNWTVLISLLAFLGGLLLFIWAYHKTEHGEGPPDHRMGYIIPTLIGAVIMAISIITLIVYAAVT